MKKRHMCGVVCAIILLLAFCLPAFPQGGDFLGFNSARSASMGQCASVLPGYANPASLSAGRQRHISFDYSNRYWLKALSTYSLSAGLPGRWLDMSLYISRFGMSAYNENKLSVSASKQLGSTLSLGIRINYILVQMAEAENVHAVTVDAGLMYEPAENLCLAAVVYNPFRRGVVKGDRTEKLPQAVAAGVSYRFLGRMLVAAEVYKESRRGPSYRFGAEYEPVDMFVIRAGLSSSPFVPTAGIGLRLGAFDVDLAFAGQASLGPVVCSGLTFRF